MRIGLLPLYIDIYDIRSRKARLRLEPFYEKIASRFEACGVEVVRTEDFCCLKPQFDAAMARFEAEGADAIVTLHMAYSPSLEAIEALTKTELPVIILDTTETLTFSNEQEPAEIMYNHGIHGVMDLCSMLKRFGKPYAIAAGHFEASDVIDEAIGYVRSAVAARALTHQKVGLFGGVFPGMGDFTVEPKELQERFGIRIEEFPAESVTEAAKAVTDVETDAEYKLDRERFDFPDGTDEEGYRRSLQTGLGLRKFMEECGLTAFSVNFRTVNELPFIECCKAMERGIGYAGEGDGLTSAFTGAFLQAWPETNFVEIFCPDWENGFVFLSHMGEINYRITDTRPLVCHAGGFVDTYAGYAKMKGGKGVYVNVSRGPKDYQICIVPAEMLSIPQDHFPKQIRGWMRPLNGMSTAEFLKALSQNGATHHSSFIYGATAEELQFFGALLHMETVVI